MTSRNRRRRIAAIAGFCLAVAAPACGDGEGSEPTVVPTTGAAVSTTAADPLAVDDVDAATRERVLAELGAAIEGLQSTPVEITIEMIEDGEPRTATARVDQSAQLLEAVRVAPLEGGGAVTTRNVVVDGRVFLKSTTGPEAEAALDYTELPFEPLGVDLLEEVFTGYARINKTLDRILLLLESVPFAAQITETDVGTEISVIMSPVAIYDFYGESGIESVGGNVPPLQTRLAFLIEDGVLRGLVADGTHFHDGEALEVSATIAYEPIEPFALDVPPIQE